MVANNNNSDELFKEQEAFFFLDTPHLKNLLYLLDYLVHSTSKISLITGVSQAGKTALLKTFLQRLPEDVWCNYLSGHLLVGTDEVVQSICQRFELQPSEQITAEMLVKTLDTVAKDSDLPPRRQLLIIDDAQALDEATLEFVVQLALCSAELDLDFRLLLFSRPELEARLTSLPVPANMMYRHAMSSFKVEECRQLLNRCFGVRKPGDCDNVLEDSYVNRVYQASQGLPGRVLEECRAVAVGGKARERAGYLNLGKWQVIAALLLLVAFIGIYLTRSVNVGESVLEVKRSTDIVKAQQLGSGRVDRRAVERLMSVDTALEEKSVPKKSSATDTVDTSILTGQVFAEPEVDPLEEKAAEVSVTLPLIEKPEVVEMVGIEENPVKEPIYSEDEQFILTLAPTDYTIQLMGSRTLDRIAQLRTEVGEDERFRSLWVTHKNAPWVVLTYGHYKDRQRAVAAELKLHPDLRKLNPWIRRMADIQEVLRSRTAN